MGGKISPTARMCLVLAGLAVGALVLWQTAHWSREFALDQIGERSRHTLSLIVQALRGDLEKFRHLPQMQAATEEYRIALMGQASPQDLQALNEDLERVNNISGALDTYLMDATGLTVAASNWASDRTFIGKNFSYRPYFQAAMEGRLGRYFALGTTSGERGYYFAYPVRHAGSILGAVVVKIQVGHYEGAWNVRGQEVIVADRNGVVFLSSEPSWTFKTLRPLDAETVTTLKQNRRYGEEALSLLPFGKGDSGTEDGAIVSIFAAHRAAPAQEEEYLVASADMADAGWRVLLLAQTREVNAQIQLAVAVAAIVLISFVLAGMAIYQRRRRLAERIALQEKANQQLERRVQERTNELTEANLELRSEVTERKRTEKELRETQATLLQTTKLAALGQMSAGLSHELNQPLAAIRSYADNARAFLDRDRRETAKENLTGISELTDRMARIIRNLRTYTRKPTNELRPTPLEAALDGSLTLLERNIVDSGTRVFKHFPETEINILGGDVRLQQIFMNLITNALDAMESSPKREIHIEARDAGNDIVVTIRDTGPGIAAEQAANVFDPFYTTKGVGKGMGLGLSITFGLVNQFGGSISVSNAPEGGAVFTLRLKRADGIREAVA